MLEDNVEKLYYNIGEVAAMFNVSISLIRFWETEFKQLSPRKTKGGTRKFTKNDIDVFSHIYRLVKVQGYTLDGARERLPLVLKDNNKNTEVINKLYGLKEFLENLKSNLK